MSNQKISVLIIGLHFAPEHAGNAPYTSGLAKGLSEIGYDVTVFTGHPHYPEWRVKQGFGQWILRGSYFSANVIRFKHFVPKVPKGISRLWYELTFGARVFFTFWNRHDVVIFVSPAMISSAMAMMRAKITHRRSQKIVWVQDLYYRGLAETGEGGTVAKMVLTKVEKWLFSAASKVVLIHKRFADRVLEDFSLSGEGTVVIRNWAHVSETSAGANRPLREAFGWTDDEIVALHTGNMGVKQGLENVINAAKVARDNQSKVRFVLVGDGGERPRLEALAQGIESIQFLPPVSAEIYADLLASADCLLVNELAGVSEMALPSKITSYLGSGRPIVAATSLDGITADEIRASGAGIVVAAGDPESLVAQIEELFADKSLSNSMGEKGVDYRRRELSEDSAVSKFDELIRNLLQVRKA